MKGELILHNVNSKHEFYYSIIFCLIVINEIRLFHISMREYSLDIIILLFKAYICQASYHMVQNIPIISFYLYIKFLKTC